MQYRENRNDVTTGSDHTHPSEEYEMKETSVEDWTWRNLPGIYLKLSKSRLTGEVVCKVT